MAKGSKCVSCGKQRCKNNNSHFYCPDCGAIFWDLNDCNFENGKGKGSICHNCGKSTLHNINDIKSGDDVIKIYRCSTCHAVLICK